MQRYTVIDMDGHVNEPFEMWEKYLDPNFHEHRPRLVRTDDGVDAIAFAGGVHVPANNGIGLPGTGLVGRKVGPRTMYEYRFAPPQAGHSAWWTREKLRDLTPPLALPQNQDPR